MTRRNCKAATFGCALSVSMAFCTGSAFAQQFEPGQFIYFKYCGEKTEAKVISTDSSGIKIEAKNPLTGKYDGSNIRYVLPDQVLGAAGGGGPANASGASGGGTAANPVGGGVAGGRVAQPVQPDAQPVQPNVQPAYTGGGGSGPMSEGDILGFLRGKIGGGDPFANPQRLAILDELTEMVKRRGVTFRMDINTSQFYQQLAKFGPPSGTVAAILDNYQTPVKAGFYNGTWKMFQSGGTTLVQKGNTLYRRMEYAGNSGSLTINGNGTYDWNSASGRFQGQWRRATKPEMDISYKGGEGLVLLHGKAGQDWIVHEDDTADGQNIRVANLGSRGTKEVGGR